MRQPNATGELRDTFLRGGVEPDVWEDCWRILGTFQDVFESAVLQTVVISLRSHWDWYVRRLGDFVRFARLHVTAPPLTGRDEEHLASVGTRPFREQLRLLEHATGSELMPEQSVIDLIEHMTHVRNLGLHNRWEVDERYRTSHQDSGLEVGELRLVSPAELESWSNALRNVVRATARAIGTRFVGAPPYPEP